MENISRRIARTFLAKVFLKGYSIRDPGGGGAGVFFPIWNPDAKYRPLSLSHFQIQKYFVLKLISLPSQDDKENETAGNESAGGGGGSSGGGSGKDCEGGFEHPLSDLALVGGAIKTLPSTFHILLQTISDLMLMLPLGSAMQQAAVSCFSIK